MSNNDNDKKVFERTANRTKKVNLPQKMRRGGRRF